MKKKENTRTKKNMFTQHHCLLLNLIHGILPDHTFTEANVSHSSVSVSASSDDEYESSSSDGGRSNPSKYPSPACSSALAAFCLSCSAMDSKYEF